MAPPPGESWALQRLKIPALWDKGLSGAGVTVGHLDTGVDKTHPAVTHAVDAFAFFDLTGKQVVNIMHGGRFAFPQVSRRALGGVNALFQFGNGDIVLRAEGFAGMHGPKRE